MAAAFSGEQLCTSRQDEHAHPEPLLSNKAVGLFSERVLLQLTSHFGVCLKGVLIETGPVVLLLLVFYCDYTIKEPKTLF